MSKTKGRKCNTCHKTKSATHFYKNGKAGLYSSCKECQRAKYRMLYKTDDNERSRRKAQWKKRRLKRLSLLREFVYSTLLETKCIDCGEDRLETLDFDHVRGKKIASIAKLLRQVCSMSKMKKEMAKCQVRCSNCHRVKTAKQLGWIRAEWLERLAP